MGQPMPMDPAVLLAVATQVDAMAAQLEAASSFDPAMFQAPMTAGLGPIRAPFTAAYTAAAANHVINAQQVALNLHAFAQGLRDSVAHYTGTEEQNATILAQLDTLPEEMKDQLPQEVKNQLGEPAEAAEAGFKEKLPLKESPDPPPGMPPPPPDPPIPSDVAAYNSETNPWDKVAAGANKAEAEAVREYFRSKGWNLSDSMLGRYLQNTGEGVVLPDSTMNTIVNDPQITPALGKQMDSVVGEAVANARNDPSLYGIPQAVSTPYYPGVIARDNDITNADGRFSVATSALVTVNPPDENGQTTYSAESQTHMYDYYYLHETEQAQWDVEHAFKQSVDDDMRMLESEGWAKSFRVHGTSQVATTTGTYDG